MVPYRSNGSARAMMARALTSVGTRAAGRPFAGLGCGCLRGLNGAGGRAPALGPGLTYQSPGALPFIPYEAAKRMKLGALGTSVSSPVGQGAGAGAASGAATGASIGSAIPVIGTAIGAVIGAIGGAIAGAINKKDPEQYNFDQAVAIWQQNPDAVYAIGNKYLPLAGLFDLNIKTNIPIYKKYGHMGEQKFVTDLANLLYRAGLNGQITASDTPLTIMSRIVQPWIDSFGYGSMQDPHADLITRLIIGMILDYVTGAWKTSWYARGGDFPFGSVPSFQLPAPVTPAAPALPPPVVAAPAPTPVPAVAAAPPPIQADGAAIGAPTNQTIYGQGHVFGFTNQTSDGGYRVYVDGSWDGTGGGVVLMLKSGQVFLNNRQGSWYQWNINNWTPSANPMTQAPPTPPPSAAAPSCVSPLVWNGTQCVSPPSTVPVTTPAPPSPPPTTAQVPAGFNQVAADQAGNPIFSDSQGVLYSWNGAAMQQFTGQLATNSSQAAQMQAAIQAALAQGYSNAQAAQAAIAQQQAAGMQVPPDLLAQATQQAATTAAAPTVTTTAAGVGGMLSGTTGIIAVGLTVVGLIFATARPAKSTKGRQRA